MATTEDLVGQAVGDVGAGRAGANRGGGDGGRLQRGGMATSTPFNAVYELTR